MGSLVCYIYIFLLFLIIILLTIFLVSCNDNSLSTHKRQKVKELEKYDVGEVKIFETYDFTKFPPTANNRKWLKK